MATTTPRRVYAVHHAATGTTRLVRAVNVAAAIRHVVRTAYAVEVASQDALIELLTAGTRVEDAGADDEPAQAPAESMPEPPDVHTVDLFDAAPETPVEPVMAIYSPHGVEIGGPAVCDLVQEVIDSRRRANASGQDGEDAENILAHHQKAQQVAAVPPVDAEKLQERATQSSSRAAPRYRNPTTGECWSGRGLKPRWLADALAGGKTMADFSVEVTA